MRQLSVLTATTTSYTELSIPISRIRTFKAIFDEDETDVTMVSSQDPPTISSRSLRIPVDNTDYLVNVVDEYMYQFQVISHGNRNAIKSII